MNKFLEIIKTIEIVGQGENKNTNKNRCTKKQIRFNQTKPPSLRPTP
jgi:hypothetical protein